jgi:putative Holliday junction resolvase
MTKFKGTTVLGLDYGTKRIGIATGQTITHTAAPITTLTQINGLPDWNGIQEQIKQWSPDALIVGIPYHLDGKESDMTQKALDFSSELEQRFSIPVYRIDETLSSHAAEEILNKKTKIGKHNKSEVDKMAAAIIVQSWLNQQ